MEILLRGIRAKTLVISFSNEGFMGPEEMEELLGEVSGEAGRIATIENDYKRYIGAQIGIHNPKGERVGTVSHVTNKEYLYVVARG